MLLDINGNEQKSEAAKGEVATSYFQKLFKSSNPPSFTDWFSEMLRKVSREMNESLISPVSDQEIKDAVFFIRPSSAPGPDGMSGLFFQHYWDTIGPKVITEVKEFFVSGSFPKEWNYTHLCLLPKIHHPSLMTDLRPISLCSVIYKVISKILVRRLQPLLPLIISDQQSAFVSERLITDNIMVAHEMVHSLNTNASFSSDYMAVKSDMSKAFDRVEWSYLRALLIALGFNLKWVDWIMVCVSSVTYSVLINDQAFGMIVPEKGLRQGDPLSPFLFVMCTEGLTHLLNQAQHLGRLTGIQFHNEGPMIHHLLFADDSLFICKANAEESQVLLETLAAYGAATGQVVNPSKSSISFGVKVDEVTKKLIQDKLGIFKEGGAGTYLGLPECFSGSKIDLLNYLKDRLKSKLSGWFTKNLSQGGKEVLLKVVALAMPVFAMSCFKLPKTTCENLSSAMSSFWWSSTEGGKKINWVSWEKMCLSKELGGLGFKDIQLFNEALLAKQAWRLIQFPDSLFSSIMKARYFPLCDFLEAGLGSRSSFTWRSILHGRELLKKGLLKRVGNGNSIRVWMDPWIEDGAVRMPWIMNPIINIELRVKDLIDFRNRDCDIHKLEEHFFPGDILKIRKKKPLVSQEDFLVWRHNKSGDFSVKSAYWLACQIQNSKVRRDASNFPSINTLKDQAWKLQTDPKIKVFLWKALSGALPVADRLNRRGMRLDNVCQGCGGSDETINHVLFSCPIARQIWALSDYPSPEFGFDKGSVFSNINHLLINRDNRNWPSLLKKKFPWIIWRIWKNRNSLFFEGNQFLASDTISKIDDDVQEWFAAQVSETIHGSVGENTSSPVVELGRTVTPSATCPNVWKPPPSSWLKCNVGCAWSAGNSLLGCSWVLRDERGVVLLHSRNAIPNIRDKDSASFQAAFWSLESLLSLGITKVILETEDASLVGCVLRPKAWPSFKGEALELLGLLERFQSWKFDKVGYQANRGARLIAQSVSKGYRIRSYIASSHPSWLNDLFANERVLSSI